MTKLYAKIWLNPWCCDGSSLLLCREMKTICVGNDGVNKDVNKSMIGYD